MRISVPKWAWGWVAAAVAALFAFMAGNGAREALNGSQEELKATIEALGKSQAQNLAYEADNAKLKARADSLARLRAKRDTVYVTKRDSAMVWLDPITGISPDSAATLIPHIQNACRNAIASCDELRAAAAAENQTLREGAARDSARIGELTLDRDSLQVKLLDALTDTAPAPTFGEKVKKVATVVVVVLAIIGSFFVGQAVP